MECKYLVNDTPGGRVRRHEPAVQGSGVRSEATANGTSKSTANFYRTVMEFSYVSPISGLEYRRPRSRDLARVSFVCAATQLILRGLSR